MNTNIKLNLNTSPPPAILLGLFNMVIAKAPATVFEADKNTGRFNVFYGVEKVGEVYLEKDKGCDVIKIKSNNIKKRRGQTHTRSTTKVKVALKICLEVFRPQPVDKVAKNIIYRASQAISSLRTTYEWEIVRHQTHSSQIAFLRYASAVINREPSESLLAPVMSHLAKMDINNKLLQLDAIIWLEQQYKVNNGVLLVSARDDSFVMVDLNKPDTVVVVKSTYDLAPSYQEKLAILKIFKHGEAALNVGIKFPAESSDGGDCYFLAGGDTIPT